MTRHLCLGTRGSALALAQSHLVVEQLTASGIEVTLRIIQTTGDRIIDRPVTAIDMKGAFVSEIEQALLCGEIDLAVHSLKDLPGACTAGVMLAATPVREDPRDVLVGRTARTLAALPPGALVGTSSPRRRAQLLALRPDVRVVEMRGNVDTRLRKLDEGQYDAICLAAAGLRRLGQQERITEIFGEDSVLPAPGQGALAIQTRAGDEETVALLSPVQDNNTWRAVTAERAVLAALGGGCGLPLGALATVDGDAISLTAVLCAPDGTASVRESIRGTDDAAALGTALANRLRQRGASLLAEYSAGPR